jgi:hypothetical protein
MADGTRGETRIVPFHGDFVLPRGLCFPRREELVGVWSGQGRWLRGILINDRYDGGLFATGSSFAVFSLRVSWPKIRVLHKRALPLALFEHCVHLWNNVGTDESMKVLPAIGKWTFSGSVNQQ